MYNLLLKELRLSVHPFYYVMPFLTGALMLVPGWLYFVVFLYFCFITVPNICATYKAQNDLIFTVMLPVNKKDIVGARVALIVLLEMLHMVAAFGFGIINRHLYGDWISIFLYPTIGFWGLSFMMLGTFNILFFPIYYKTAYKYGLANVMGILGAMTFAGLIEWAAIKNEWMIYYFKGEGVLNTGFHFTILFVGMLCFLMMTYLSYRWSVLRFEKVEI